MCYVIILLSHEFYSGKVKYLENYILWFDNWRRVMKLSLMGIVQEGKGLCKGGTRCSSF